MSEIICAREKPRKGKTTIITAFITERLLNPAYMTATFDPYWDWKAKRYEPYIYTPEDVYANYWLNVKGVHCLTNEEMLDYLEEEIERKTQKKIVALDECGQLLPALNYQNKRQMAIVRSFQQYPKLYKYLLYCSAPGNANGVDPNLREITFVELNNFTYHHNRDRQKDSIDYHVQNKNEEWESDETFLGPAMVQRKFDSRRPVV